MQFSKNINILQNQETAKQNMLKHSRLHQSTELMALKFFWTQTDM